MNKQQREKARRALQEIFEQLERGEKTIEQVEMFCNEQLLKSKPLNRGPRRDEYQVLPDTFFCNSLDDLL